MQVVARVGDFGFPACPTGPANVAASVSGTSETLSGFMTMNPACGRPRRGSVAIDHGSANADNEIRGNDTALGNVGLNNH